MRGAGRVSFSPYHRTWGPVHGKPHSRRLWNEKGFLSLHGGPKGSGLERQKDVRPSLLCLPPDGRSQLHLDEEGDEIGILFIPF